jgi:hypothetical protein
MANIGGPERPHTGALVALVFVAVALVGLGTGFLVGWAGSGSPAPADAVAQPTSSSSSSSASPKASPSNTKKATPRGRADSEIERGRRNDLGYVVGARQDADGMHVTFDRAVLYFGADARRAARQLGLRDQLVNGRLLVNQNDLKRDLVLAPNVEILGQQQLAGSSSPKRVSLQQFLDAVANRGQAILLDLQFDRLGYVVTIRERELAG